MIVSAPAGPPALPITSLLSAFWRKGHSCHPHLLLSLHFCYRHGLVNVLLFLMVYNSLLPLIILVLKLSKICQEKPLHAGVCVLVALSHYCYYFFLIPPSFAVSQGNPILFTYPTPVLQSAISS